MKTIPLSRGATAMIDDEDFEKVSEHKWTLKQGPHDKTAYAHRHIKVDGRWTHVSLHRFILNPPAHLKVDHINGNGIDCRRSNMRICTHRQNLQNMRMHNKHGLKGVAFMKDFGVGRQWISKITTSEGLKTIGYYATAREAAAAYNEMAVKHHGEFARLNPL